MEPADGESGDGRRSSSHSPLEHRVTDDPSSDDVAGPTVSRRSALRLGATGVFATLAGCTGDVGEELPPNTETPVSEFVPNLPVAERTDLLAEAIHATAAADVPDEAAFASVLEAEGLEIESVERVADVLAIEYVSGELYEEGTLHGVGPIAGAYAALVDAGDDSDVLGVTILDPAPASFGAAVIEAAWARAYNDGTLSGAAYGELVTASIETSRHPPDVVVTPDE